MLTNHFVIAVFCKLTSFMLKLTSFTLKLAPVACDIGCTSVHSPRMSGAVCEGKHSPEQTRVFCGPH